jgi:hypothetical protein
VANLRFKDFVFNHAHGRVKAIAKIPKSKTGCARSPNSLSDYSFVRIGIFSSIFSKKVCNGARDLRPVLLPGGRLPGKKCDGDL